MFPSDLQALIFDFDRTLAPLGNFVKWREALPLMREAYLRHGVPDELLDAAPRGCFGLYGHVARHASLPPAQMVEVQSEVSAILEEYEKVGVGRVELFAGVREMLDDLPGFGLRVGIVSSNPSAVIRPVLAQYGVEARFVAIVGREGIDHIKPDPESMRRCCERLSVDPAHCMGIGDNAGDAEAALAAGMSAVGVCTGVSTREALLAAGVGEAFEDIRAFHAALRESRGAGRSG